MSTQLKICLALFLLPALATLFSCGNYQSQEMSVAKPSIETENKLLNTDQLIPSEPPVVTQPSPSPEDTQTSPPPEITQTPLPSTTTPVVTPESNKKFVGSTQSDRYHFPDCRSVKKISPSNEIWFSSTAEAKSKGYVPCKICKPPSD